MTAQDSAVNIATAVIDLGIPVSQGLDEYYRDWNHFGADVHALCSSIKNLDCAFRAARDKLEGQEFALIRSMEDVQATIMFCEADIMELKKKLEKIKFKERPQSFKFKAAMGSVRSLYPFQRCTIKKIQDLVNSLRRRMQHILRAMNIDTSILSHYGIKEFKKFSLEQLLNEEARAWLSPLALRQKHQELLSIQHPSTAIWFVEHEKFLAWRDNAPEAPRGLWCVEDTRTEKPVLLAYVMDQLQALPNSEDFASAYISCDWRERTTFNEANILGSIVQQILQNFPEMSPIAVRYYQAYEYGKKPPSIQDLYRMFQEVIMPFNRIFIIVDGLNELGQGETGAQGVSMSMIEAILKDILNKEHGKSQKISLLISSSFGQQLDDYAHNFDTMTILTSKDELREFIRSELESTSCLVPWTNPELGQLIKHDLELRNHVAELCLSKANDTFFVPCLHLNLLRQKEDLKQLLESGSKIPVGISESIRQTMDRIQSQSKTVRDLAIGVLYWTLRAKRPLRISELRHALRLDPNISSMNDDKSPVNRFIPGAIERGDSIFQARIVASCAGLISVDDQTGIVRLIHLSIAEHLEQTEYMQSSRIHTAISRVCMACLSNDKFTQPESGDEIHIKAWIDKYPLLSYSLEYWGHHAGLAAKKESLENVKNLLLCRNRVRFLFRGLYWVSWATLGPCAKQVPDLFLTAYFGLTAATRELLANGKEVDQIDSFGRTSLYMAAALGQTEIIKILLNLKADISGTRFDIPKTESVSKNAWWLPPWARDSVDQALYVAAESGHLEVVRLLIEGGAKLPGEALEGATFWGHTDIARLLLQHGSPITRNALQASAYSGRVDLLGQFLPLIKPRLDSEYITEKVCTQDLSKALYAAALAGDTSYAQKLLEHDVDPNESTYSSYRTPLQAAASRGYLDMMKLLLRHGATVNDETEYKGEGIYETDTAGTALQAAAFKGEIEAVHLLLLKGANTSIRSGYYGNAIQAAAAGGHQNILEVFLKHNASVNSNCGFFGNPLQAAASIGSETLVKTLLDRSADVNAGGGVFGHALQAAAWSGSTAVIKLLLDAGAKPINGGSEFLHTLQAAAVGRPLVDNDAQVAVPKATSLSLEFESFTGRELDMLGMQSFKRYQMAKRETRQIDPPPNQKDYHTGIETAILRTNEGEVRKEIMESPQDSTDNIEAIKLLIDAGIDVNESGFEAALHSACYAGHLEIATLLLDRGIDLKFFHEKSEHPYALKRAAESGHIAIVELLLKRGTRPTAVSGQGRTTPLHLAAGQSLRMVQLILAHGADINGDDERGRTPVECAILKDRTSIVKFLIQEGADVNQDTQNGGALRDVIYALGSSAVNLDILRAVLDAGANAETITKAIRNLIDDVRADYGEPKYLKVKEPLRLLVQYGTDVNNGATSQEQAAALADVPSNFVSFDDRPPALNLLAQVASEFEDEVDLVKIVVEAGVDLERWGSDALWLATREGHRQIVEYLEGLGVKFEEGEDEGVLKAREEAMEENRWEMVHNWQI